MVTSDKLADGVLLPEGRLASQPGDRPDRSHRGHRGAAGRGEVGGGHRESEGAHPEQADQVLLINTHAHFDHSGGLRTYVDEGAIIVTHEMNRPYYEKAWSAPHRSTPDRLEQSKKPAMFETFSSELCPDRRAPADRDSPDPGQRPQRRVRDGLPAAREDSRGGRRVHADGRGRAAADDAEPVLGQSLREHPAAEARRAADCRAPWSAPDDHGGSASRHPVSAPNTTN